jgi:hypothetical protein
VLAQEYTAAQSNNSRRDDIMNIVLHHVSRLLVVGAMTVVIPQFASAAAGNGPTFSFAMGPMSAAQKNQGTSTQPDAAATRPHYRSKHRHRRSHHAK